MGKRKRKACDKADRGAMLKFVSGKTKEELAAESAAKAAAAAATKKRYEETRTRDFQDDWKVDFKWVFVEDGVMYCNVCKEFPAVANKTSRFFSPGCNSFRRQTLQAHHVSPSHTQCQKMWDKARGLQQPGPMDAMILRMNEDHLEQVTKLFNTTYHVAKLELPFSAYPSLVSLQQVNGLDLGANYHSHVAAKRFLPFIHQVLQEPVLEAIRASRYISVMVDASTDSSNKDLESMYIRYMADGKPVNRFICVEELQLVTAVGHKETIEKGLEAHGLQGWKQKLVALGTDGASVMSGRNNGLVALLLEEIPYLLYFHCGAHKLELAALDGMKDEVQLKKVVEMLNGIYRQYHYSPKAWRELQEVGRLLEDKVLKPTNLGGTRWLPHLKRALTTLLQDFRAVHLHFENTVAAETSSKEMQGRARNILKVMNCFKAMMFVHLVLDILDTLSSLSLELQRDAVTLASALTKVEACQLQLTDMQETPGEHFEGFLKACQEDPAGQFKGVELKGYSEAAIEEFKPHKRRILQSVLHRVETRMSSLDETEVNRAAARFIDPREWPTDHTLAGFGNDELDTLCDQFEPALARNDFDRGSLRREWAGVKAFMRRQPRGQLGQLWENLFLDPELREQFSNILQLVEIVLVFPLSTAAVERGFSCMKRVKTDWRSRLEVAMLSKLMFISIEGPSVQEYHAARAVQAWWDAAPNGRQLQGP